MTTVIQPETGDLIEITGTHPVADLFPLLDDEELNQLAADINERGLANPVLVTTDGVLMDGRNRLAACDKASVKPTATVYYGDDPVGMILALNVARRHMSKGQLAITVAEALSLDSVKDWGSKSKAADSVRIDPALVSRALAIHKHAPELVSEVKAGVTPLNDAYAVAKKRKDDKRTAEQQQAALDKRLATLRDAYPDLAAKVDDDTYSLAAAEGEAKQRDDDLRGQIERRAKRLEKLVTGWIELPGLRDYGHRADVLDLLTDNDRTTVLSIEAIYEKGSK